MVAATLLQFVLFSVYDNAGDLLIHEDQYCAEECWWNGEENAVNRIAIERWDYPAAVREGRFEFVGYFQLWGVYAGFEVEEGHGEDCYDDGKVADELTDLKCDLIL